MMKALRFYGRFLPSFTRLGYLARGLWRDPVEATLTGQTWLVTGATGGIGRAVALGAARLGATVWAVGRRQEALTQLAEDSDRTIKPKLYYLDTVRGNLALAHAAPHIDVLVNNVGILNHHQVVTSEGFEQSYATNLLGPFALTESLIASGKLSEGLIINVASGGLYNAPLNLPMLDQKAEAFSGVAAYASHKRAQLALSDRWNELLGLGAYTMHPGWVATEGVRAALPGLNRRIGPILRSAEEGADTVLWLAAQRPAPVAGRVWFDRKDRIAHAYAQTRTPMTTPQKLVAKLEQDVQRAMAVAP